ncbi:MAG: aminotransferase class V-fold PLP-dependent enzyme, partial [Clostridia bacterium]|nr:aminotransferase class V-fold PLP-dependent enzyme [Clostridia bacterium]
NVPGIAGFGVAAEVFDRESSFEKVAEIKKVLTEKILERIDDVTINGGENAIPYVLNMSFKGVKSEVLLHSLESAKIMVSSGSACSSNHPSPSHVLMAMGVKKELIDSSLRLSFSSFNSVDQTETVAEELRRQVAILRKVMR